MSVPICNIDFFNPIKLLYLFPETNISKYFFENFSNLTINTNINDLLYQKRDNQTGKGITKQPFKCNLTQKISTYIMIYIVLHLSIEFLKSLEYTTISTSLIIFLRENCVPPFMLTIINYINTEINFLINKFQIEEHAYKIYTLVYSLIISLIHDLIKYIHNIIKSNTQYVDAETKERERMALIKSVISPPLGEVDSFESTKVVSIKLQKQNEDTFTMDQIKDIIGDMPEKIDIFYKNLIDFLKRVDNFINYICVSIFYKSKQDGGLRKSINKRNKILKSRKFN
jgi:hypothetical protein